MDYKTIHIDASLHEDLKREALDHHVNLRELVEAKLKVPVNPIKLPKVKS